MKPEIGVYDVYDWEEVKDAANLMLREQESPFQDPVTECFNNALPRALQSIIVFDTLYSMTETDEYVGAHWIVLSAARQLEVCGFIGKGV